MLNNKQGRKVATETGSLMGLGRVQVSITQAMNDRLDIDATLRIFHAMGRYFHSG